MSSKGSQTTDIAVKKEVTLERDLRPLLFKFNEVHDLLVLELLCLLNANNAHNVSEYPVVGFFTYVGPKLDDRWLKEA